MFEVGDLVRLKSGSSIQKVIEVGANLRENQIRAQYLSRLHDKDYYRDQSKWRIITDYVHIDTTAKEPEPMTQLYQTKEDTPRFGTQIATNSKGQMVLEMKGGNGEVEAFGTNDIEEVMPYTIELSMLGGERSTSKSIIAQPDQVEKDEVLLELSTGLIWRVTQLDSKARSPKPNKSQWLKIPATKLTFGAGE